MKLDVLAFHAHPDDNEIMVGGTLARLAEQGYAVGCCELTRGEMGTRGTVPVRERETAEAARILGLKARVTCALPDSGLFNVREQQLRVVEILRTHRPEVVILPGLDQRHPDHAAVPRIVFDACYFAGLAKFPDLMHDGARAHRPRKILWTHGMHSTEPPTFVVDISGQMEKKLASIRAHASQFPSTPQEEGKPAPLDQVTDWVKSRGRAYGMMIGKTYGEAYVQREMIEIEDIVKMGGKSI